MNLVNNEKLHQPSDSTSINAIFERFSLHVTIYRFSDLFSKKGTFNILTNLGSMEQPASFQKSADTEKYYFWNYAVYIRSCNSNSRFSNDQIMANRIVLVLESDVDKLSGVVFRISAGKSNGDWRCLRVNWISRPYRKAYGALGVSRRARERGIYGGHTPSKEMPRS